MLHKGAGRDLLIISAGPLGSAFFSILLVFIVSWNFRPEVLGALAILELIAFFFVMIFTLGLDQAYVREYAGAPDKSVLFATAMRVPIATASLLAAAALVILPLLGVDVLKGTGNAGILVAVVYGLSALVVRMLSIALRMGGSPSVFAGLQGVQRGGTAILLTLVIVLTPIRDLTTVMLCYLAGAIISVLLHIAACWNEVRYALTKHADPQLFRTLLRFGIPAAIGALFYSLFSSSDRLSLAALASSRDLGIYSMALSIAGSVNIFTAIFAVIWAPLIYKNEDQARNSSTIRPYLDTVTLLTFLAGAAVSFLAWFVPMFFPADYASVPYFVPACMALPLCYVLAEAFGIGIGVSRRMGFATLSSAISAVVSLTLSFLLVPRLGVIAAALGIAAGAFAFLVTRTELAAILWYRVPSLKLYLAAGLYFLGCTGSLIWGSGLGSFFPLYWIAFGVFCLLLFHDRVLTILSLIRRQLGMRA